MDSSLPGARSLPVRPLRAAIITPRGRGAVATIALEDDGGLLDAPPPLFHAANGRPVRRQPVGRIVFGHWGSEAPEEVVVCRASADLLEIHCHGGDAAASRIASDLARRGVEAASPFDFARDRLGEIEAETLEALSRAPTLRTADILLQQRGRLRDAFAEIARSDSASAAARIHALLRWADFGRHLTRPWNVAIVGRPNVGKSSLVNALVGFTRSIVFDQPGTTRDVVTVETAWDGWPLALSDTAGLRRDAERLEAEGIRRTREAVVAADLVLLVLDSGSPPRDEDRQLMAEIPASLPVAHKCDLPNAWGDELPACALRVSSLAGSGVNELLQAIVARLIPELPPAETPLPISDRQVAQLRGMRAALQVDTSAP